MLQVRCTAYAHKTSFVLQHYHGISTFKASSNPLGYGHERYKKFAIPHESAPCPAVMAYSGSSRKDCHDQHSAEGPEDPQAGLYWWPEGKLV